MTITINFRMLIVVVLILTALVTSISANEFIVGDANGWTLNFDYQAWAEGKEFVVGDTLVFKYPVGVHNVLKVNGTAFQECTTATPNGVLSSGNDVVTLGTPGKKWYICGVGKRCESGNMKLVINVNSPAPVQPPETSPAPPNAKPIYHGVMVIIVFVILLLAKV